ncbi:HisA/HisF-related TIM barrel protein [Streptomyces massasporeus]|uniref:HisA/HisF-related TIM barrel protein n=1 Tax=Streptomyces massasporeus TaxID=67324 RepID=UPI0033CEC669
MTSPSPLDGASGPWRVNVDLRHGAVSARPGHEPDALIDELVALDIPIAVIDLDRSIDRTPRSSLLERAVRRHPGRLWLGGRLAPTEPLTHHLLDIGAAGVLLGSSSLFRDGRPDPSELGALARFPLPERLMASIDVLDDRIAINGFTTPTPLPVHQAFDAIAQATGGRCPVLYTDVAAALRSHPPSWPRIRSLADAHPGIPLWYAGGLTEWTDVHTAWRLGLGAVVGRAYLDEPLGLSRARESGQPEAADSRSMRIQRES